MGCFIQKILTRSRKNLRLSSLHVCRLIKTSLRTPLLGECLEKLNERRAKGLLHSVDFLKELLTLAKEIVQAENQVDPVDEQSKAKATLAELFVEVKSGEIPMQETGRFRRIYAR